MLRAKHKEERRQRIFAAAETLIRERRSTDFSINELAALADVSPTTIYNLVGGKGTVLFMLLQLSLERLMVASDPVPGRDPLEQALSVTTVAAGAFIADPDFFRPLHKFQLGEQALADRGRYMDGALAYWRTALQGFIDAGQLTEAAGPDGLSRDDIALALLVHSLGVIDLWVQEDIGDREFRSRMIRDTALMLFAVANEAQSDRLRAIIRSHGDHVTQPFAFRRDRARS